MKIVEVRDLAVEGLKVVKFARFMDSRGYFTEPFRKSDVQNNEKMAFLKGMDLVQSNESFSRKGTVRGLHFQWNPFMGKWVRTLRGSMVDLALDIRKGSPTFGKIILYEMSYDPSRDFSEWIWVPPGFAHGNFFTEDTVIEYFCTGEYSQGCEACLSPLARDIDWSMCDQKLKSQFDELVRGSLIITDKDRNGLDVEAWLRDARSDHFLFHELRGGKG